MTINKNGQNHRINISDVNGAMIQTMIVNLLGSIQNETITGLLNYVVALLAGVEPANMPDLPAIKFKQSYVTPGKVGYSDNDAPFTFSLGNSAGFTS
jgi:hypothetical protein